MLELVKGHSLAKTIEDGVLILMEQDCWRLSILGEIIFIIIFDTALSFVSKWALATFLFVCCLKGGAPKGGDLVNNTPHGAKALPILLPLDGGGLRWG